MPLCFHQYSLFFPKAPPEIGFLFRFRGVWGEPAFTFCGGPEPGRVRHGCGTGAGWRETAVKNSMVKLVFWPHLASWELSWVILGLSWASLGSSWAEDGHGRGRTEGIGCREFDGEIGVLATFGLLGAVLGHLGPVLGFSWVILGLSCLILGRRRLSRIR